MTQITALDQSTIDRIAAGEVVERPAAAVKELVENSLDAGADTITVELESGGTDRITVRDDGHGMAEESVRRSVRQHTTSKINELSDLERIGTLGFRGEALHAIGAVSRLTVSSRSEDAVKGTSLTVVGGTVESVESVGRPVGTTVTVRDLFYNVPARRKHLSTESTEFGHCNRVVSRYALANPGTAIALHHNDREIFATPGRGDLQEAALSVFGREVAESLISVEAAEETLEDSPLSGIRGYVSDPETTRSTREYMATYVNGRYVENAGVRDAILTAYGGQLAADRFPFTILFLDCPPDAVDVNIHPRKLRVRFGDDGAVTDAMERTVAEALQETGMVRSAAPRGRSAPPETDVSQSQDSTDVGESTTRTDPFVSGGTDDTAISKSTDQRSNPTASGAAGTGADHAPPETEGEGPSCAVEHSSAETLSRSVTDTAEDAPSDRFQPVTEHASLDSFADADSASSSTERVFEPDRLPAMTLLGRLAETYLLARSEEGIIVVDQHAADERIHYERLAAAAATDDGRQRLVDPVNLEVTASEAAIFESSKDELESLGFEATLQGRDLVVTAVPTVLAETIPPERLVDLLAETLTANVGGPDAAARAADEFLADLACHPAITGNTRLPEGSAIALLEALDDCDNPYACPHGRPTIIRIGMSEIADRFERDYPGHQVRRPEEGS